MTLSSLRLTGIGLALAGVLLAGCGGSSSSASPTKPPASGTAATTPKAKPTPVLQGGDVAAVVNGESIPMDRFRVLLNLAAQQAPAKQAYDQAMNQVILFALVEQYASAHHITVSDSEINAQINKDQISAGSVDKFKARLAQLGLTEDEYRQLLLPSLLGRKVQATLTVPDAKVQHILIGTTAAKPPRSDPKAKALAEQVLKQVESGGNFAALAAKYSDDPGSKNIGGIYTVFPHQMVPEFDHASFTLPLHHPAIVHTQYGYHIIEVLSRGKGVPTQAQQSQQVFQTWLQDQLKRAKIKRIAKLKA